MRWEPVLLILLLAGCVEAPPSRAAEVVEAAEAPGPVVIPPAVVPLLTVSNRIGPNDELFFNESGLRAINVSASQPFAINAVHEQGRRNDPVFLLVLPAAPAALASCGSAPESFRFHSFITDRGTLLGHAFGAGDYTILLYSERLENLSLRLGSDEKRAWQAFPTHAPAVGLEVVAARTQVASVAFPYRAEFSQPVDLTASTLFVSEFRVRSNAHSGAERIETKAVSESGQVCAGHADARDGLTGIAGFESQFIAALGSGRMTWSGSFESNASANPRFDATGYALRFG